MIKKDPNLSRRALRKRRNERTHLLIVEMIPDLNQIQNNKKDDWKSSNKLLKGFVEL